MNSLCNECKNYPCDRIENGTMFGCKNWVADWERAVPLEPVRDTKRHSMPTIVPSRTVGKRYHQLCLFLKDYKHGIYTTEEVATLIEKLFK